MSSRAIPDVAGVRSYFQGRMTFPCVDEPHLLLRSPVHSPWLLSPWLLGRTPPPCASGQPCARLRPRFCGSTRPWNRWITWSVSAIVFEELLYRFPQRGDHFLFPPAVSAQGFRFPTSLLHVVYNFEKNLHFQITGYQVTSTHAFLSHLSIALSPTTSL